MKQVAKPVKVPEKPKTAGDNLSFEKVGNTKRGKGDKQYDDLSPPRPVKGSAKIEVSPLKKSVSS